MTIKSSSEILREYAQIISEEQDEFGYDPEKDWLAKEDKELLRAQEEREFPNNWDDPEIPDTDPILDIVVKALRDITLSCRKYAPTIDRSRAERALRQAGRPIK